MGIELNLRREDQNSSINKHILKYSFSPGMKALKYITRFP